MNGKRVLLIGYGNPGRLDDGLGPALAEELQKRAIPGLHVQTDYQLAPEDAHAVAAHDVTVFADAALAGRAPFAFERLPGRDAGRGLGSHALEPDEVAGLARALFGARGEAYTLAIRGYRFDEFGEDLSAAARANLAAAADFMEEVIRRDSFAASVVPAGGGGKEKP